MEEFVASQRNEKVKSDHSASSGWHPKMAE
jgi:hypothetical protein